MNEEINKKPNVLGVNQQNSDLRDSSAPLSLEQVISFSKQLSENELINKFNDDYWMSKNIEDISYTLSVKKVSELVEGPEVKINYRLTLSANLRTAKIGETPAILNNYEGEITLDNKTHTVNYNPDYVSKIGELYILIKEKYDLQKEKEKVSAEKLRVEAIDVLKNYFAPKNSCA